MTAVRLYFDDDCARAAVLDRLKALGHDVSRSDDHGMRGARDEEHLALAAEVGAVLCTSNVGDYMAIHSRWLAAGRQHSGVLCIEQQRWSIGQWIRFIDAFCELETAEGMMNRIEFLSAWREL